MLQSSMLDISERIMRSAFAKRLLRVPYYGAMALLQPENGRHVAALSELTGTHALETLKKRLQRSVRGRWLLSNKPLIDSNRMSLNELVKLAPSTLGHKYAEYMVKHAFNADERPKTLFVADPDLAYVITRYRQIHDFWHVLCDLPPTLLGEIALKAFEWRTTGLPSCGLSSVVGPLRLSLKEQALLVSHYYPWALRAATECEDLMAFDYEGSLHRDIEDVRAELNLEPVPQVSETLHSTLDI